MNHIFIVIAHSQPDLLARIIKRLEASNHYFLIHIDKKTEIAPFLPIKKYQNVQFATKRLSVNWGGYSQIKCTLFMLTQSMCHEVSFDYFHLISGVDYPLVSNDEFDRFFEHSDKKSYMHFDSPKETVEWRKYKYPNRLKWAFLDNWILKKTRIASFFLNRFFPRKVDFDLYAGWSWWSWHRDVVSFVLNYLESHPQYHKRFYYTSCCDEVIFHTMLFDKAKELRIEKYNSLRYIDWYPTRPTPTLPLVLDERDFESIINSGCFFCRKIDGQKSKKLMDMIDDRNHHYI